MSGSETADIFKQKTKKSLGYKRNPALASDKTTAQLVSIQLLRVFAAATVVFGHAENEATQVDPSIIRMGFDFSIGVDIFFIISGFVMWFSSAHLFGTPGASWIFAKRRFFRVVPLYWIYTIAMLGAIWIFPSKLNNADINPTMIFTSFIFYPFANTHGMYAPILVLGWTLNYEMFFYMLFALSLFVDRARGLWTLSALILGFVTLAALGVAGPVAFWGQPIILEFLVGVLIGQIFQIYGHSPRKYWFVIALVLSGFAYAWLSRFDSRLFALGIPCAIFVVGFIFYLPRKLDHFLSGIARLGGDSSYSLYLSHPFSLALVKIAWLRFDPGFTMPWGYVGTATLSSIFAGYVLYRFVERPLLRVWGWNARRA